MDEIRRWEYHRITLPESATFQTGRNYTPIWVLECMNHLIEMKEMPDMKVVGGQDEATQFAYREGSRGFDGVTPDRLLLSLTDWNDVNDDDWSSELFGFLTEKEG